jgi:hypothetical protein
LYQGQQLLKVIHHILEPCHHWVLHIHRNNDRCDMVNTLPALGFALGLPDNRCHVQNGQA